MVDKGSHMTFPFNYWLRRTLLVALGCSTLAVEASAQQRAVFDQAALAGSYNGAFRSRFGDAERQLNAVDLARAEILDALRKAEPSIAVRDSQLSEYLANDLFRRPPRIATSRTAGGQPFRQLVPEMQAAFDWTQAFRRQVYDVLAAETVGNVERDGRIIELLGYYRSRPALAISGQPKDIGTLNGEFGARSLRAAAPRLNGQLWAMQWLELALFEALMNPPEQRAELTAGITGRFQSMLNATPDGAPFLMPVSTAVAPSFAARYPEVAAILDNLHLLQDYSADLMLAPDVPRSAHRRELLRALQMFRSDTASVATYTTWMDAPKTIGVQNMGGAGTAFGVAPVPTAERGMALSPAPANVMAGMDHGAMKMSAQGSSDPKALLERMLADPVIRERAATDPVLQRMLAQAGMGGATATAPAMAGMTGMQHGSMATSQNAMPGMSMPAGNLTATNAMANEERRIRTDFLVRLFSDSTVAARIHSDPELHRLWSDPDVQKRIQELQKARGTAGNAAPMPRSPDGK
jgi:hypothetical protein